MIKQKATEYCVPLKNEPASHARATQALAKAGINVTALHIQPLGVISIIRFLCDKENSAVRKPLEQAGYEVFERPVFQMELPNHPGELSRAFRAMADEDIRVLEVYGTADGAESATLVFSVDQPERASQVLGRLTKRSAVTA